jgi:hypothetical protein
MGVGPEWLEEWGVDGAAAVKRRGSRGRWARRGRWRIWLAGLEGCAGVVRQRPYGGKGNFPHVRGAEAEWGKRTCRSKANNRANDLAMNGFSSHLTMQRRMTARTPVGMSVTALVPGRAHRAWRQPRRRRPAHPAAHIRQSAPGRAQTSRRNELVSTTPCEHGLPSGRVARLGA